MTISTEHRGAATATIRRDGTGVVVMGERTELIAESTVERARARAIGVLIAHAAEIDRPLTVVSKDPSGLAHLVVNPNGNVEESTEPVAPQREVEMAPEISYSSAGEAPPMTAPLSTGAVRQAQAAASASASASGGTVADAGTRLPEVRSVPTPTPARGVTPVTSDDAVDDAVADQADPVTAPKAAATEARSAATEARSAATATSEPSFDDVAASASETRGANSTSHADPEPAVASVASAAAAEPVVAEPATAEPVQAEPTTPAPAAAPAAAPTAVPAPTPAASVNERPANPSRRSFIEEETEAARAERGFRGTLNKMGFKLAPNASEASERSDINRVSQHWAGPRTIAIVNGKGGASKTPTTAMLSAVFARNGGSGVLAWDNNETRGTLGWRTEQAQHEATVQALLPNAALLMSAEARSSDLTGYLHHQVADKYDVLRSNPNILAEDQRLTSAEFDAIHGVAAKYFRLIFIDSGNDESADRWRRMIDRADQIVIATTARGEHAEAGALLLEALRDRGEHSAQLAKNAVVVVSQADHKGGTSQAQHVADGFRSMARTASVIPFDPAMRAGKLAFDSLKPETQRAWLSAAAGVAQGL